MTTTSQTTEDTMTTRSITIQFAQDAYNGHDSALTESEIERFETLCSEALAAEFPGVEISVSHENALETSYRASGFEADDSPSCNLDEDAEESARTTVDVVWNSGKWTDPS
jgi:hypothetical protein